MTLRAKTSRKSLFDSILILKPQEPSESIKLYDGDYSSVTNLTSLNQRKDLC